MNPSLFNKWWLVTLKGLIVVALAASLLVHPYITTQAIVIFFGGTILTGSALTTWFVLSNRQVIKSWKWFLAEGFTELNISLFLFLNSTITLNVIVLLFSVWIITLGVFQIVFGFQLKEKIKGWKYNIVFGLFFIIIGLIIIFNPMIEVIAFTIIFGLILLFIGLFLIYTAQRMGKQRSQLQSN